MSIFSDPRQYGTDEERAEWLQDVRWECRADNEEPFDDNYEQEEEMKTIKIIVKSNREDIKDYLDDILCEMERHDEIDTFEITEQEEEE